MERLSIVSFALVALVCSTVGMYAAESETDASARPDSHHYKSFEYTEASKTVRLIIPDGLAVVRGILVVGPYARADSRDYYRQVWYREFMHLHGFAFLGAQSFSSHVENFKVMQNALKQLAADSKHPELVNAPYATTGFSAGGGFASRLLVEAPGKVIASVIVGSRLNLTGITPTAAHLGTPACIINGEHEQGGMAAVVEPVLADNRPKGALWGWMAVPGIGHEFNGQEVLAMPMLDAAVRLRYPTDADVRKGPVNLKPVDPKSGWIADNTTWKSGLTKIAAAKDFKGDITKSSWLLNQDLGFIYRAYSTYDRPLKITSPHPMSAQGKVWDAGSSVVIRIDDTKFASWKKLELYDGAMKVSELTKGPAEFTVKNLQVGYHAFSVLGTDGKGNVRPSNPVLVVVRKLAVTSPPAQPKKNEPITPGKVISNAIGMKLGYIPPGTLTMGSPPGEHEQYKKDNTDDFAAQEIQHEVSITKGFYMGAYAVTQEEYETVMGKNPSFFSAAGIGKDKVAGLNTRRFPVEWVSWDDATLFCKKLSQKEGINYRLPTEAEWEYACRAGTETAFYFGDTISTDQANYAGDRVYGNGKKGVNRERPTPVGSFPANAFGLYDMHGNVWQWCQDWYDRDYYQEAPRSDPVNETAGKLRFRVLRGGSWHNLPGDARSACRFLATPVLRNWNYGFRVVVSSLPPGEKAKSAPAQSEKNEPSGKVITNSIGMKLVYIPPGRFVMGSPRSEQEQYKKDSRVGDWAAQEIQHEVAITKGFYMGVYAVTQEEYEIVTGKNPSWFSATGSGKENVAGLNTRRFPVETVSWNDATEFCRKLSQKEGKTYRLPTEAEWEYACRAGTKTAFSFGDTISTDQANYNGNAVFGSGRKGVYRERPMPVGSFPANAFGLCDMHGNVNQWCQDWYDFHYYRKSPRNDPVNETGSEMRVLRSGSWGSYPGICRSAHRSGSTPDYRNNTIGFRVVMSLP